MKSSIVDTLQSRNNCFLLVRLTLVLLVIHTHSFFLDGVESNQTEFIREWSNSAFNGGNLAVSLFFIISGFLVTESLEKNSTISSYLKKRALRIFPGLFGSMLFCAFVSAPFTGISMTSILSDTCQGGFSALLFAAIIFLLSLYSATVIPLNHIWSRVVLFFLLCGSSLTLAGEWYNQTDIPFGLTSYYFKECFLLKTINSQDGTVVYNFINIPVWSIRYELCMYLLLAAAATQSLISRRVIHVFLFLAALSYTTFLLPAHTPFELDKTHLLGRLACCFFAGVLFHDYGTRIPAASSLFLLCFLMVLFSIRFHLFVWLLPVSAGYCILYAGSNTWSIPIRVQRIPDLSYGMFLYGYPVQSILTRNVLISWSPLQLTISSLILAAILASISWYLVEKPSLSLK